MSQLFSGKDNVKQKISKYQPSPESDNSCLCYNIWNNSVLLVCDFTDNALSASCVYVLSETADISSPISAFSFVGEVVGAKIYQKAESNTMAAIWNEDNAQVLGLTPISSDFNYTIEREVPSGAIDLGLSVFWATQNVGASAPEKYGRYFSWGETSTKSRYTMATYKWCEGKMTLLTKYNTNSANGVVDGKTRLEPEDDAAHQELGESWRMPTIEELEELLDECTLVEIKENNKRGYEVTGPNGNKIYIPSAGYKDSTGDALDGFCAIYWTSELYSSNTRYAASSNLSATNKFINTSSRECGLPIRPVYE